MKKLLLSIFITASASMTFAQTVVFDVLTPADQAGFKPLELAIAGGEGWEAMPDLNILENAIEGELVFVSDETAGDSLGCNPLINGSEVNGKIGVVWRGACNFSVKALNIFNAGGIGVIIINNAVNTAPIVPGGGMDGTASNITIPVIMTDRTTGEALTPSINAGNATAYIGIFEAENDLAIVPGQILRAKASVIPASLAQNESEFSVPLGAKVYNLGSAAQTGVTVTANITYNGTELYNAVSTPASIEPGDSVSFVFPIFSQNSYPIGSYVTTYSLSQDGEDQLPLNNLPLDATFTITENVFSYSTWNETSLEPNNSRFFFLQIPQDPYQPCIVFSDPNASRVRLDGMWFAATSTAVITLTGQSVNPLVFEWNDEFIDIEDPDFTVSTTENFTFGFYDYAEDLQQEVVYVQFEDQFQLSDNQRYLICVGTSNPDVLFGYVPSTVDYTATQQNNLRPISVLFAGTGVDFDGFGPANTPAFALDLFDLTVGLNDREEVKITPFPNPTADFIAVPYTGTAGQATLSIFDLAGKMVKEQRVIFAGEQNLRVDMNGVPNGSYVFNLQFDDNTVSNFKVVVAR